MGFMSPTTSSVAKSPRHKKSYPKHAVTTNGDKLVMIDRWPAAAAATQPVKSTQKPALRKHSSEKNAESSYAEMQRLKREYAISTPRPTQPPRARRQHCTRVHSQLAASAGTGVAARP